MKKVVAIIPARGGSKGIPRKNLVRFRDKPLIQWTIESALNSQRIDETVITSDDDEILEFSSRFDGVLTLKRPGELALDHIPTQPVIQHVIETLYADRDDFYILLLQPTSPLRTTEHIDEAIDLMKSKNATTLISVTKFQNEVLKCFVKNEKGHLEGIRNNEFPFTPRQELPSVYKSNGAIYILDANHFRKEKSFWSEDCLSYEMDQTVSLDIDTVKDLET